MAAKGKVILGQPWWVWAAGGAAILGGYLWIRHRQNAAAAQQAQNATTAGQAGVPAYDVANVTATEPAPDTGSPTGTSWAQLMQWLADHQGSGKPQPEPKGHDKHPGAFHIRPGQHPPTVRHGGRVWVKGHYGPHGAYHPGHWSGSGQG